MSTGYCAAGWVSDMLYDFFLPVLKITARLHRRYHLFLVRRQRRPALLLKNPIIPESHYAPTCRRLRRLDLYLLRWLAPGKAASYALDLFEHPHRMPCKKTDARWLSSLRQDEVICAGQRVVVYCSGASSPARRVLLIHGWEARAVMLRPLIESLTQAGCEVMAPDLPAHGESGGERCSFGDLVEVIRRLGDRYGVFCAALGHSFGGTALLHAATRGFQCRRLVILSSPESLPCVLEAYIAFHRVPVALTERIKRVYLKRYGHHPDSISYTRWPPIAVPTLVCHDRDDQNIALTQAFHLLSATAAGELYITQGSGHRGIVRDRGLIQRVIDFVQAP
ncbi:alpha/beta fold hydrolase [Lonsdalea populi]|uniref:alpha/beta fold hydrolase n=1 Tax=Lonsdalea populi TaxID=1172565 RepID=UPI000B8D1BAA|nr:alpha/beta hydrolase [Lonsdalea populi]